MNSLMNEQKKGTIYAHGKRNSKKGGENFNCENK